MKAIIIEKAGGVENLQLAEIEKPAPQENEVLIEVKAIGVNPVDYKVRAAESVLTMIHGEKRPVIIGWDVAGVITAIGSDVSEFALGDKVFGMLNFPGNGNAYAEYVAAPDNQIAKMPENCSYEEAAASTLAALTVLQVLESRVQKDDRVLIHAGSGGVGHFAIQIAKSLGAYVITTSSGKNKEFVMSLGADEHIDYRTQAFEDELTDIDFVFDMFNGEILLKSIQVVKEGGAILSLPTSQFSDEILAAAKEGNVDVSFHMVQSNGDDMHKIKKLLERGAVKPHVSQTFDFKDMGQAHLQLESGRTVGKVVVTV